MATANEILQRLNDGEIVFLNSEDVGEFMLECYRHNLSSRAVHLRYKHGRCRMEVLRQASSVKDSEGEGVDDAKRR